MKVVNSDEKASLVPGAFCAPGEAWRGRGVRAGTGWNVGARGARERTHETIDEERVVERQRGVLERERQRRIPCGHEHGVDDARVLEVGLCEGGRRACERAGK